MFAGGQFRHDAAVFGVQLDLRGDGAGQNPAVAHDGGAGFIAGSFNGQESHACWSSSFSCIHAVGKSFNHGWTQMNTDGKKDFSQANEFTNR
jgi:hypothetical protein